MLMATVNLSPGCVDALKDLQECSDTYVGMIEFCCDYIIDSANLSRKEVPLERAMLVLLNLKDIKQIIEKFRYIDDDDK